MALAGGARNYDRARTDLRLTVQVDTISVGYSSGYPPYLGASRGFGGLATSWLAAAIPSRSQKDVQSPVARTAG